MPNRILREGILTSERVNSLDWDAEVFYRRLMSVVDDFGRYTADPRLLRTALYPLQLDKVREANITKWLDACVESELVFVYSQSRASTDRSGNRPGSSSDRSLRDKEKQFLVMLDFRQQIRAKVSKYPDPPDICIADAMHVHITRIASAHLDGGGGEDEVVISPPPRAREGKEPFQMYAEWEPSGQFQTLAKQAGLVTGNDKDFQSSRVEFISYWLTQPRTRTQHEWDHAFLKSMKADKLHAGNSAGKPVRTSDSNWRRSEKGIEAKGKEYGLSPRPGEEWHEYARRIDSAIEAKIRGASA